MFQVGSKVQYWSESLNKYVKMTVEVVHADGRLQLSGKKGQKIDPAKSDVRLLESSAPSAPALGGTPAEGDGNGSAPALGGGGAEAAVISAASAVDSTGPQDNGGANGGGEVKGNGEGEGGNGGAEAGVEGGKGNIGDEGNDGVSASALGGGGAEGGAGGSNGGISASAVGGGGAEGNGEAEGNEGNGGAEDDGGAEAAKVDIDADKAPAALATAPAFGVEASGVAYVKSACEFLRIVMESAKSNQISIARQLTILFPPSAELKSALLEKLPWRRELGYLTFQRHPSGSSKGCVHVAMLSYAEDAYPGKGVYLSDAAILLEQRGLEDLDHRISLRPESARVDLSCFGWMSDGSIVNGTRAFALSVLALYSLVGRWQVNRAWPENLYWPGAIPPDVVGVLVGIKCKFTRHENLTMRTLSNLVESAVHSKTNRSIEDPIFMSQEMLRCSMGEHGVKTIMSLYKQRAMTAPSLKMQPSVEACTLRFMQEGKVCEAARMLISSEVRDRSWQGGRFTAHALMASKFPVHAPLANWYDKLLVKEAVQSASGQTLAVNIALRMTPEGSKITQADFDEVCGACGMWVIIETRVLPQLAFGSKDIESLGTEFEETATFRSQINALTCKEPSANLTNFIDLAKWVLDNVPNIRLAKDAKAASAAQPGHKHPSTVLNNLEQQQLNVGIYIGQLTLDVNAYRDAAKRFKADSKNAEDMHAKATTAHIADMKAAIDYYRLSDIYLAPIQDDGAKSRRAGGWFESAAVAARGNLDRVTRLVGARPEEFAVLNIVALNTLGTLKIQVLNRVQKEYAHFPGATLVMYPVVPSDSHGVREERPAAVGATTSAAAFGATDTDSNSDPEVDPASHDFVEDTLPEAITRAVSKMSMKQRQVQLERDHATIYRTLLFDCKTNTHFGKTVNCVHVVDGLGVKEVTTGLLLMPVADDVQTGFESSSAVRTGTFTDVPASNSYVIVTKKVAMQAKRAEQDDWKFEVPTTTSRFYNNNKTARGQLGEGLFQHVLTDFVQNCSRKYMLVNDMIMGCGEIGLAAIGAKTSEAAASNGVRLFYFGHEHRRTFHHVAGARVRKEVGEKYLAGKLVIDGRIPVAAPAARNVRGRSQIATLLDKPLAHLTINDAGDLILPDRASTPVERNAQLNNLLDELVKEFPQPEQTPSPTPAPTPKPPPPVPGAAPAVGGLAPAVGGLLPPGTVMDNRDALAEKGFRILKETPSGVAEHLLLLAEKGSHQQVFLENCQNKNCKIDTGSFVGKGGPGEFLNATRVTDYKKDTPKYACGGVVLEGQEQVPKLRTLSQCEEILGDAARGTGPNKVIALYAHVSTAGSRNPRIVPASPGVVWVPTKAEPQDGSTFLAMNMGQWMLTHDTKVEGKLLYECCGVLRPGFELALGSVKKQLSPNNRADANPVALFTNKVLHMKAKGIVAL